MLRALLYLRLTSLQNWLRSRIRRLRQPKYLFGAIVGIAYFYLFFFRPLSGGARRSSRAAADALHQVNTSGLIDWLPIASAVGGALLMIFMLFIWVVPTRRAALGFSEAEIAFLFPAPITRRNLVHFRLLSSQFRSLIGAALMMLLTNRWSFLGGNPLTHAIGWWFVFSTLSLHFSGAKFTLSRMADRGARIWPRRALLALLPVGVIALTFFSLPDSSRWPLMLPGPSLQPLSQWVMEVASTAPLSLLLWPFRLVLGPFLAVNTSTFLLALVPALLVVTLHYLWVVRTAVAFEDAAIEQVQHRSDRAAWRAGGRGANGASAKTRTGPFILASIGRPEIAFLWKNLLSTWPYFTPRVFLACAGIIVAGSWWMNSQPLARGFLPGVGAMAVAFALYTLMVGPQFARQDIRNDLNRADVLKAFPLAGWQIVLGELLTPVAILTGVLWLSVIAVALTFQPGHAGDTWLTPGVRLAATVGAAAVVPLLATLQLLVPNAAALLFPGWFHTTRMRGGGPEVVGQRMIFFFAQVLTMVFALVPALLAGAVPFAAAALFQQTGQLTLIMCCLAATGLMLAVLVAEVALGLWLLGSRFERLDLSAELQP